MNAEGSAAERDAVRKLARGSLFSRLKHSRHPLKLVAVPRDHVAGDRQRGDALLAGRFIFGSATLPLADLDFGAVGAQGPLAEQLQGYSRLRDLAGAASREKGARLAEAIVGRWLLAHGARVDEAWAPHLWGERILFWTAYAPYILSSTDSGYRSALLNTLARGARHLDANAERAPSGLRRVTAWCGVVAAGLLVQGGVPRVARGEAGLARALTSAQFDDGVLDAAPPPPQKMAAQGSASTLAFELSDGQQRLVVNCGGPGPLQTDLSYELVEGLRTTAAHSTLVLADTNSTNILADGSLGKGVEDVTIDRTEDNDASRLEASHDGYVRAFGLIHKRSVMLGNDGKELRGADQLIAKGRKKIRESAAYAVRFHLAPGVEATVTADGMGAILRSRGAPPWNFRCRGAMLTTEESLWIDGRGQPQRTSQLVIVGEVSALGGEIGWQFRRTS